MTINAFLKKHNLKQVNDLIGRKVIVNKNKYLSSEFKVGEILKIKKTHLTHIDGDCILVDLGKQTMLYMLHEGISNWNNQCSLYKLTLKDIIDDKK